MKLDEIKKRMDETEHGCKSKDCKNCVLFLSAKNDCYWNVDQKWQKWAQEQSMRYHEYLRSVNEN